MKVKEAFSKDFKKDTERERTLKKSGKEDVLELIEQYSYSGEHIYSTYSLEKNGIVILLLSMPDPLYSEEVERNFYLKYQTSTREFLMTLFDFLLGSIDDMVTKLYLSEQEPDLDYIKTDGIIKFILNDKEIGLVNLEDVDKSEKFAKNFINFFAGKPLEYDWVEIR